MNVSGVHSRSEVVIQGLVIVALLHRKEVENEAFDIFNVHRIAFELVDIFSDLVAILVLVLKVLGNVQLSPAHLVLQQVHLVEEEDEGDGGEDAVVDDGVKDVSSFLKSIHLSILQQDLKKAETCCIPMNR